MDALIKMKDGTEFLTPVENLDNVKRMLAGQYKDISFPDYEAELEDEDELPEELEIDKPKSAGKTLLALFDTHQLI